MRTMRLDQESTHLEHFDQLYPRDLIKMNDIALNRCAPRNIDLRIEHCKEITKLWVSYD
jgi:hypothetical protein